MNNRDEIIDENIDGEYARKYEEKLNNFFEEKNKRKTKLSALQSLLNAKLVSAVILRRKLTGKIIGKEIIVGKPPANPAKEVEDKVEDKKPAPFNSLKELLIFGITADQKLRELYMEFRGKDDLDSMKLAHQELLVVLDGALSRHRDSLKTKGDTSGDDWKNTKAALDRIHSLKSRSKEKTEKPVKSGVVNAKATPTVPVKKEPPVKLPQPSPRGIGVAVPPGGGDSAPPPSGSLQRRSEVSSESERVPTLEELDEIERLS